MQVVHTETAVGPFGGRVTMPVGDEAYVSKEVFLSAEYARLENERLWPRVWQIACRVEEVENVGDYVEYTIGDQSIFVVRVVDCSLKAYYNACLHRGTPLKYGCGNAKEIRCPYHAWRWNLDGTIKEVIDKFDFDPACVDTDRLRLPECLVDTWGGFVFINMDRNAAPLLSFLGPIPAATERYEFDKMCIERYRTTVVAANWKTALFAFNEGYHTSGTHPQTLFYLDDTGWDYETFEIHGRLGPPAGASGRPSPRLGDFEFDNKDVLRAWMNDVNELEWFSDEQARELDAAIDSLDPDSRPAAFMAKLVRDGAAESGIDTSRFSDGELLNEGPDWALFPNALTPTNSLSMFFQRFRPNGLDPESCLVDVWNLRRFPDGQAPKNVVREFFSNWRDHDEWGRVVAQDLQNIANVQRGMHSRSLTRLICGRQELNIWNHLRVLDQYINQ